MKDTYYLTCIFKDTQSGETTLPISFLSLLKRGQLLNKRICSKRSKFFLLRIDLIVEGYFVQGCKRNQEVTELNSFLKGHKMMAVHPYNLKTIRTKHDTSCTCVFYDLLIYFSSFFFVVVVC